MPGLSSFSLNKKKAQHVAVSLQGRASSVAAFTSRAHEGRIHSLPPVPAAGFVKGQALLSGPCHDFRIPGQVFSSTQRLDSVDSPTVGVRHVERARHGVDGQIVFVCWVVALVEEAQREMRRGLCS